MSGEENLDGALDGALGEADYESEYGEPGFAEPTEELNEFASIGLGRTTAESAVAVPPEFDADAAGVEPSASAGERVGPAGRPVDAAGPQRTGERLGVMDGNGNYLVVEDTDGSGTIDAYEMSTALVEDPGPPVNGGRVTPPDQAPRVDAYEAPDALSYKPSFGAPPEDVPLPGPPPTG